MTETKSGSRETTTSGSPASWGPEVWQRFTADLRALDGTSDVFRRRRAVVMRLLAQGMSLSTLEALLPGWSLYLEPMGSEDRG